MRPTIRSGVVLWDFTFRIMLLRSVAENVSMFYGSLIHWVLQFNDPLGLLIAPSFDFFPTTVPTPAITNPLERIG